MFVVNIIGYDFSFKHNNINIIVPFDYKVYEISDDVKIDCFKELKKVDIVGMKEKKPLEGVRLKKNITKGKKYGTDHNKTRT